MIEEYPNGNNEGNSKSQNTGTETTNIGEVDISSLGPLGQYAFSKTGIAKTPVVGSAFSSAIGGLAQGLPASQVGYNAVHSGVKSGIARGIDSVTSLPIGSTAASLLDEMTKENPNYMRSFFQSAIPTATAILGSSLLPGFGGWLGGMAGSGWVSGSLDDGYLGDIADTRSHERVRDQLEDRGLSVDDTASMAAFDRFQDKVGNIEPTTVGNISVSPMSLRENDMFGSVSLTGKVEEPGSLAGYLESIEKEMEKDNSGGNSSGSSGVGGPGSSGTGGDPGGGGFGIGY